MSAEFTSGRAQRGPGIAGGDSSQRSANAPRQSYRAPAGPQERTPARAAQDKIRALLQPVVAEAGFDLEDLRVEPAGRRRLVRVIVDADGGVSLDDVALLSQRLSAALDETDLMGAAPYALEVSSPGVDRPLTEPRHWRRAAGRLVRIPLVEGGEITGRVLSADEETVTVEEAGERRSFGYAQVGRGRVQVEFRRDGVDEDEGGASWTST